MPYQRGEQRPGAVLTEGDVLEIREMYASGTRLRELHQKFGDRCSMPNLHHIVHGRRWRYLLPEEAR